ncbi:hypothetical protein [Fischerella thermalis]|uniref:hypothetical protein n=1 Tax=Fischerella thermalis TaxID=372787 RepID=UPI000E0A7DF0|nr:hypothetical protein [Fischerella thermalis]RDH51635.1 hypothetical protein CA946_00465 [Fischerella thermalis 111/344/542]
MQAISVEKPNLPEPPTFSTPEEERLHRKQRLAAAFRLFSRFGFNEGWFRFQPLYEMMVRQEPDLLE